MICIRLRKKYNEKKASSSKFFRNEIFLIYFQVKPSLNNLDIIKKVDKPQWFIVERKFYNWIFIKDLNFRFEWIDKTYNLFDY